MTDVIPVPVMFNLYAVAITGKTNDDKPHTVLYALHRDTSEDAMRDAKGMFLASFPGRKVACGKVKLVTDDITTAAYEPRHGWIHAVSMVVQDSSGRMESAIYPLRTHGENEAKVRAVRMTHRDFPNHQIVEIQAVRMTDDILAASAPSSQSRGTKKAEDEDSGDSLVMVRSVVMPLTAAVVIIWVLLHVTGIASAAILFSLVKLLFWSVFSVGHLLIPVLMVFWMLRKGTVGWPLGLAVVTVMIRLLGVVIAHIMAHKPEYYGQPVPIGNSLVPEIGISMCLFIGGWLAGAFLRKANESTLRLVSKKRSWQLPVPSWRECRVRVYMCLYRLHASRAARKKLAAGYSLKEHVSSIASMDG